MPVHRSVTTRRQGPNGEMVTTTVREGTRRRWGEVNRYLFGGTKSYSTTTTRTRYADGTVVTTTGDTYGALKGGLLLLVVVIALLVGLLGGGGGGSNKARVALHIAARATGLSVRTGVCSPSATPTATGRCRR